MTDTRREFFKRAAILGGAGALHALLPAIEKAAAILPAAESTYLDAEHVVILMQENRSFDHAFGTLRGVRGFNDPRAVTLPDQLPVWFQTNASGEVYAPFHLNAQETKATWLGGLPHSWTDQNDAKNHGDHDKWLIAKPTDHKECLGMPLTMGFYNREDLPFYYALADAFTICDQHFCSSLTATTPNRLYLWSGTIRPEQRADSPAHLINENVDYGVPAHWTTFPERLEDAGIDWKIYQNELSVASGLSEEHDAWLTNFTDNPIEWFSQYAVQFAESHRAHLEKAAALLPAEIETLQEQLKKSDATETNAKLEQSLSAKRKLLKEVLREQEEMAGISLDQLPARTRNLHAKAFTCNTGDPDYRELSPLRYKDGSIERELKIPKGDILFQFREDVNTGKLPSVSWIVAPENFSDHPGAAWYGAWYLAEVMNILTHNPEVWRKTIFILTYDENDGFFDHVPPFGAPHPGKPETGSVSEGIDAGLEYVTLEQCAANVPADKLREGSIGLGFRVPLLIASPWNRGGSVCSQVFDHTSILQFLEKFASRKSGKPVRESNITEWRRTVCGDLTSVFQLAATKPESRLPFPAKDRFIERVHKAQFRELPGYKALTAEQIDQYKAHPHAATWMPQQEPGVRPACALPYEFAVEGRVDSHRESLDVSLAIPKQRFGDKTAGAPFHVYAPGQYLHNGKPNRTRSYAVKAGDSMKDSWDLSGFGQDGYHLCVCGPNGYLVELSGDVADPFLSISAHYGSTAKPLELLVSLANSHSASAYSAAIEHHAYGFRNETRVIEPGATTTLRFDLTRSFGWYDFSVRIANHERFRRRYAGHVETGMPSFSDPALGRQTIAGYA